MRGLWNQELRVQRSKWLVFKLPRNMDSIFGQGGLRLKAAEDLEYRAQGCRV